MLFDNDIASLRQQEQFEKILPTLKKSTGVPMRSQGS